MAMLFVIHFKVRAARFLIGQDSAPVEIGSSQADESSFVQRAGNTGDDDFDTSSSVATTAGSSSQEDVDETSDSGSADGRSPENSHETDSAESSDDSEKLDGMQLPTAGSPSDSSDVPTDTSDNQVWVNPHQPLDDLKLSTVDDCTRVITDCVGSIEAAVDRQSDPEGFRLVQENISIWYYCYMEMSSLNFEVVT